MNLNKLKDTKPITRVMGVDCSSNSFAFSIFEHGTLTMWGEIDFKGRNLYERLGSGQRRISALRDQLQVDKIVFESAVYVQNKKTVILLAYSLGAALSPLISEDTAIDEIPPVVWQKAIGNMPFTKAEKAAVVKEHSDKSAAWVKDKIRNMRKQRTIDWVEKEFGVVVESDNVADAIGVGWAALDG